MTSYQMRNKLEKEIYKLLPSYDGLTEEKAWESFNKIMALIDDLSQMAGYWREYEKRTKRETRKLRTKLPTH